MSRTHKDKPIKWPEFSDDAAVDTFPWWKFPWKRNSRIRTYCKDWWRSQRRQAKRQLQDHKEPPESRPRSEAKARVLW